MKPIPKNVSNCGFESVSLIIGGTEARIKEFPHMVNKTYLTNFLNIMQS